MRSSSSVIQQAQEAAQQQNWWILNQCLQQLLRGESVLAPSQAVSSPEEDQMRIALGWALQILEAGDFQARWDVAKVFPCFGPIAIAPLLDLLQDDEADWEFIWFTTRILGEFKSPAVIAALVNLLRTAENEEVAQAAVMALANLGPVTIAPLADLLVMQPTRLRAVQALAQIDSPQILEPLLRVAQDPNTTVRATALEALSRFQDARVVSLMIAALRDPAAVVRSTAVATLGLRRDLVEALDLVQQIQPLLWDLQLGVCQQAAIALGRLATDEAVAALAQVLHTVTTPMPLRLATIRALGWTECPSALSHLRHSFYHQEDVVVCREIVSVLGRVQQTDSQTQAAHILREALVSDHWVVQHAQIRQLIALSLGELRDAQALELLLSLLTDSDGSVRLHAIAALKKLQDPTVLQRLQTLVTQDNLPPDLKQGIAIVLGQESDHALNHSPDKELGVS